MGPVFALLVLLFLPNVVGGFHACMAFLERACVSVAKQQHDLVCVTCTSIFGKCARRAYGDASSRTELLGEWERCYDGYDWCVVCAIEGYPRGIRGRDLVVVSRLFGYEYT
ncbi:hypothetical protein CLAFUW4_20083 [Fulvia fulva]|uniref:uncharacterized protein n=1 Tax=Passalora fulva TaxID=5499 RepID=UPI0028524C81|nr:uncharacterized protein CLAFUR5_20083 [Fulvia fulva]KAK4613341.1 hypothetical protein CLAFUR4_20083 [Fulvia fulva]KAK4614773.1 hypothetical protein CLAFUR0_20083 [Fulvia fulva]WMI39009.1 hypothetical protein CLAFUR5_20083 [Fulvia fulva]WPV19960.1 hypothetical protein CLAFUW4_20083 [Fulvia fulva]WPV35468.1 hypothetical protein CLAFUW7_20083 [Fulvia fulva]